MMCFSCFRGSSKLDPIAATSGDRGESSTDGLNRLSKPKTNFGQDDSIFALVRRFLQPILSFFRDLRDLDAIEFAVHSARKRGLQVDVFNFNVLLDAIILTGAIDRAEQMLLQMTYDGVADVVSFNCVLKGFANENNFQRAQEVFKILTGSRGGPIPNRISFNTMIALAVKAEAFSEAWEYLEMMDSHPCNFQPDTITVSSLLGGTIIRTRSTVEGPCQMFIKAVIEYLRGHPDLLEDLGCLSHVLGVTSGGPESSEDLFQILLDFSISEAAHITTEISEDVIQALCRFGHPGRALAFLLFVDSDDFDGEVTEKAESLFQLKEAVEIAFSQTSRGFWGRVFEQIKDIEAAETFLRCCIDASFWEMESQGMILQNLSRILYESCGSGCVVSSLSNEILKRGSGRFMRSLTQRLSKATDPQSRALPSLCFLIWGSLAQKLQISDFAVLSKGCRYLNYCGMYTESIQYFFVSSCLRHKGHEWTDFSRVELQEDYVSQQTVHPSHFLESSGEDSYLQVCIRSQLDLVRRFFHFVVKRADSLQDPKGSDIDDLVFDSLRLLFIPLERGAQEVREHFWADVMEIIKLRDPAWLSPRLRELQKELADAGMPVPGRAAFCFGDLLDSQSDVPIRG
uniref:Pentacotripeptide-repeat region of PRORP domain-containing protein n=1 Tax=Chromera velia CCMP2878 TaxID=1169474 RepID=A0A0G4G852_9ALVE|eukprot:Cvel_4323.t1-p1 / transcript=Cvel_4323.t1 / gene=Cvel_4323 / organism=Chromera_velia_CCMP2878 / gene_product=Pentatricopeptide repeat-containing protein, putative / transcript_product=Pentatricopeptide repeat-containing protein, putative / location=Cvel_scaffold187:70583-73658(-) / protein_length=626 / sequence_SO=supercontig / SO=protein_coding / is_pseudo=false